MADIILAGNAAWSTCNTGSTPPGATDTISLNGHVLTLDGANGSTYTCASIAAKASVGGALTGGSLTLTNINNTITANLICGSDNIISRVSVSVTNTTINGDVTTNSSAAIYTANAANVTITGTVKSGSGGTAYGLQITGNGTFSVGTADAVSGNAAAVYANGSGSTTTIGTAVGGTVTGTYGVLVDNGSTVTVGTAKGGSNAQSFGAFARGGTLIVNATDISGTGCPAGREKGVLKFAPGCKLAYAKSSDASKLIFYAADEMPANTDVKNLVTYGGGDFTGSLVASSSVIIIED
jgi:hypothetical protein